MLPRSSWKGHLRLSLVTVPVQAINAENSEGELNLHQLHAPCHSRIQYRKVCPIHGEIPNDEIVMGYEHADDQYVVLEKKETGRGRKKTGDRAVNIDTFVNRDAIEPIFFDGTVYYLVPDGTIAEKPYAVLLAAMRAEDHLGIGMGNFWGRDRLVAVDARGDLLSLQMLRFASRLRTPKSIADDFEHPSVGKDELRLASKLIEAISTTKFNLSSYEDKATEELRELIESKVDDRETVRAPSSKKSPPVINLMDALRRSVAGAKQSTKKATQSKPAPRRRARRSAG